jgi:hypothetical protein
VGSQTTLAVVPVPVGTQPHAVLQTRGLKVIESVSISERGYGDTYVAAPHVRVKEVACGEAEATWLIPSAHISKARRLYCMADDTGHAILILGILRRLQSLTASKER